MRKSIYRAGEWIFAYLDDLTHAIYLWFEDARDQAERHGYKCPACQDEGWNYYGDLAMPCDKCHPEAHQELRHA